MRFLILGVSAACVLAILLIVRALCWEFSIDQWLVWAGSEKDFPFFGGLLISLIPGVGQAGFSTALGTWVVTFFVG